MANSIKMQLRRPESSGKTPSWATSVINLVQRRNRQDRTRLKILENNKNIQSIISVNYLEDLG
jgi:hypothetical protein